MGEPSGLHQVLARRWKYAPPDWVMFEALAHEQDCWLELLSGELTPVAIESQRPARVVFRPWLDPAVDSVEALITPDPDETGSQITFLVLSAQATLPLDVRKGIRYRLGTVYGAALREWVDEPR